MIADDLTGQRGAMTGKRRALAMALLGADRSASPQCAPILPRMESDPAPLSFSQERLWFLDGWNPGSSAYNVPLVYRLRGTPDIPALQRSLATIVERHEVLRSFFPVVESLPVQSVCTEFSLSLPQTDLSALPAEQQEDALQRLILAEANLPFALATGPLIRASLFRLDAEHHVLMLVMHHIVTDAWSRKVLAHELAALYRAFRQHLPNPLPALPLQYADYALWQRRYLEGEALQGQLAYWRRQLAGAPTLLELPADRPRPAVQSYQGARLLGRLSSELSAGLTALSNRHRVTLFMTLLAAFAVLLRRYSGQEDIVIGTPIANRTRPELEGLIGFFTNTLALRLDLAGEPRFADLLQQVRETALEAYSHQELPFEKLVEGVQPERAPGHSPIFQVMFQVQIADGPGAELPGLQIELMDTEHTTAKFDLIFSLIQTPQSLEIGLEYSTDIFDRERMERFVSHYRTLLEGIVANPEQKITRLPLLPAAERDQVLHVWNDTKAEHPLDLCAHALFEDQAARTPDAVAVEFEGRSLTYAQLSRRADAVARHLRDRGVQTDARVGLCATRSLEMMVGMLGILKAGAAYVPLDTVHPPERVAYILQDAGVTHVLTHGNVEAMLAAADVSLLPLAAIPPLEPDARFSIDTPSGGAAYVLYTSGSTGRPKGVILSHQALVNLICWQRGVIPQTGRMLQFTSIGFDVSFQEIFMTWCTGGTVVIVSEETRRDPPALLQFIQDQRIETINVSVAVLQQLALALPAGAAPPSSLRTVCATAEQLQITPEIRAFFAGPDAPALYNHYGPTEAHVVTMYALSGEPAHWRFLPPIGHPIDNTQIYLLDRQLQPVPTGVPGDLYIGGICLARGYLNRPDMTAEKFVPDPYSDRPGARLYRTGDVARYGPDGALEYLGRLDNQVKIRGFRIELGEIESVLTAQTGVREAIVLAREDTPGDRRLAAYVATDGTLSVDALRESLTQHLPGYMVPSAFVLLDALPLNVNGKVDRRALPVPDIEARSETYVAPRTPMEEGIAKIWSDLLHVEQIGIHDSFFELGGHSLLAAQTISRLRSRFQVDLPLKALFEAPTIAALAARAALSAPGDIKTLPIPRAPRDRPLPLSFAQERLWFMDQLQPGSPLLNFPMALRLRGRLDTGALDRALEAVQGRHETLRTVFAVHEGAPIQIIQEASASPLALTEVGPLPEDRQADLISELIRAEAKLPFDLAQGPVYRSRLFRLSPEDHVLVLTLHHITADETSAQALMNELSAFYRAELRGGSLALPDLPVQYADYALWQRACFQQGLFQTQIDYWKEQLRQAPAFLDIPTDFPRPSAPTFSRQSHRFSLSPETLRNVMGLCGEETATSFMFFLAVFQLLLSRHTGRKDVLVGTDALNRDQPETQNLIGFFINQLVLRTDLSGCTSFRHLLRRVRSVALDGYANQELPFNKLVELLSPQRDPERPPLYQVKLAYTKGGGASPELEGLSASWISADKGVAQLDLTLFLAERPEGVYGRMEYRDELFTPATIARLVREYETMVQVYSADPELTLDAPGGVEVPPAKTDARERLLANRAKLLGAKKPVRETVDETDGS